MRILALVALVHGDTRQRVLEAIRQRPGVTRTDLCRHTALSWGAVHHHVRWLLREGAIRQRRAAKQAILYPADTRTDLIPYMRLLREDVPPQILHELAVQPDSGIQEISRSLTQSRKVIRRYLSTMVQAGLVARSQGYRPKFHLDPAALRTLGDAGLWSLEAVGIHEPLGQAEPPGGASPPHPAGRREGR
jgi:DNA-binding IclR family transcriptional regulator